MSNHRILIIEDDPSLSHVIADNLVYEGFIVECAADREDGLRKAASFAPHLILLDIMLPDGDGLTICEQVSRWATRTPMIVLTARTGHEEKIRGLALGADDYITKPFALDELLARIHAVLRRTQPPIEQLVLGDLVVDFRQLTASRGGHDAQLSHREFALLHFLAERAGRVVTRDELLRVVWRYSDAPVTRTVDSFIARLRRKIEADPRHPRFIHTVHGDGYCLTPAGEPRG